MNLNLVSIETADQVVLHGALFEGDYNKPAIIIMHGAAMNFYTGMGRFLPGSKDFKPVSRELLQHQEKRRTAGRLPDRRNRRS